MKYTPYHPVVFKIVAFVIVIAPLLGSALAIQLLWERADSGNEVMYY